MSAQQTIYERIKEDLKGDKILQNVILERLWYYLEPIKDITGGGGASITNGTADPTGGADGDYYIQTTVANQIWYNNLGTWVIILSTIPITVDQADAGTMLFGVPFPIIDGQEYIITNLGITGIDHIRTVGVNLGGLTFNNNCEAYVTDLGVYVPCTYDVASNKISCTYVLWSALMNYGPTISVTKLITNNSGETPTLSNGVDGVLNVIFTGGQLISETNAFKYATVFYAGSDLFTAIGRYLDTNTFEVTLTRISDNGIRNPGDDVLVKLEIEINISNL